MPGVERGVPLAVLLAEADDDDVGRLQQRARADRVDARAQVVLPERLVLGAEDRDAAVVARRVVGDRPGELDVELGWAPCSMRSRQSVWISPER